MKPGTAIQAVLAFLLELGLLGAAGLWALTVVGSAWAAVLAVIVVAAVWGLLLSPKAPVRPPWPWHAVAGHVLFVLGAVLLLAIGPPLLGGVFLALVIVSAVLVVRLRADLAAESARAREERHGRPSGGRSGGDAGGRVPALPTGRRAAGRG